MFASRKVPQVEPREVLARLAEFGTPPDSASALRLSVGLDQTVNRFRDTSFADANRYWLAGGASYEIRQWLTVDVGLTHVFEDSTSVDVQRQFFPGTGLDSTVQVKAHVESSVTTIGANLRVRF